MPPPPMGMRARPGVRPSSFRLAQLAAASFVAFTSGRRPRGPRRPCLCGWLKTEYAACPLPLHRWLGA
eukprot:74857-Prymnesium_polylepis.1